jgi:hypothetical protein
MKKIYDELKEIRYSEDFYCKFLNTAYPVAHYYAHLFHSGTEVLLNDILYFLYHDKGFTELPQKLVPLRVHMPQFTCEWYYLFSMIKIWYKKSDLSTEDFFTRGELFLYTMAMLRDSLLPVVFIQNNNRLRFKTDEDLQLEQYLYWKKLEIVQQEKQAHYLSPFREHLQLTGLIPPGKQRSRIEASIHIGKAN